MKKLLLFFFVCLFAATGKAQKWDELNDEQKMMKLKSFRADNQKYLKEQLGMTPTQLDDIDNVNVCYLSTLDRIDRYAKDEDRKEKLAEAVTEARWLQLDAIMGAEKHKKFAEYVKTKMEKAKKST